MLTRFLVICGSLTLCSCGPGSDYDTHRLQAVRKIALIEVGGGLPGFNKPINARPAVEAYAAALDRQLGMQRSLEYVPLEVVVHSDTYRLLVDRTTELGVTSPRRMKIAALDETAKGALTRALAVDGLLISGINFRFFTDESSTSYWMYPSARIYVPGSADPVWEFVGTGESEEVAVPARLQLRLGAKWVVLAGLSESDVAALMGHAAPHNDDLAARSAEQVVRELGRVARVSRGEEPLAANEIASSGGWGRFLEVNAMGYAFSLFLACAALLYPAMRLARWRENSEGAGAITAVLLLGGCAYYLYQFAKALL